MLRKPLSFEGAANKGYITMPCASSREAREAMEAFRGVGFRDVRQHGEKIVYVGFTNAIVLQYEDPKMARKKRVLDTLYFGKHGAYNGQVFFSSTQETDRLTENVPLKVLSILRAYNFDF